jgi:hypothetical protein
MHGRRTAWCAKLGFAFTLFAAEGCKSESPMDDSSIASVSRPNGETPPALSLPIPTSETPFEPPVCTTMGCMDGMDMTFVPRLTTPGRYSLHLVRDGAPRICRFEIQGPDESVGTYEHCQDGIRLIRKGSAVTGVAILDTPASVQVKIQRQNKTVADAKVKPNYVRVRPNGDGCDPSCRRAEVTVHVDSP